MSFNQFQKFQSNGKWYAKDYFLYNVGVASLAAGVSSNQNINIQADSNFEWVSTSFSGTITGPTEPYVDNNIIPVSVLITDGGSGRNLFNQNVPIYELAGPGRQVYKLPQPRIFTGKSTVNFFFKNFDAADTYINISLTLHGNKIFELN